MANLAGTNVASAIKPFTDSDTFATHEAQYGKGGHRSVATLAERNAIHKERREVGMLVYVAEDEKTYQLITDPASDNTTGVNWGEFLSDAAAITAANNALSEMSNNRQLYFGAYDPEVGGNKFEYYPPSGVVRNFVATVPIGTVLTKPVIVALEHYVSGSWIEIIRTTIPVNGDSASTILPVASEVQISSANRIRINIIDCQENLDILTCQSNIGLTNY